MNYKMQEVIKSVHFEEGHVEQNANEDQEWA